MERRKRNRKLLLKLFDSEVSSQLSKHLEVEEVLCEIEIPRVVLNKIISQTLILSEKEPCGLKGATFVVLLSSPSQVTSNSSEDDPEADSRTKIGRFKVDQFTVSTFELHLTLSISHELSLKVANFVRKIQGDKSLVRIDQQFNIEKKKLYRS